MKDGSCKRLSKSRQTDKKIFKRKTLRESFVSLQGSLLASATSLLTIRCIVPGFCRTEASLARFAPILEFFVLALSCNLLIFEY